MVCRRSCVSLIMEHCGILALQAVWHEAQLNEGLHVDGEKKIKHTVDIGKRKLHAIAETLLYQHTHIVVEQAVEPHITKADLSLTLFQLLAVVLPQRSGSMAASYTQLPIFFQRFDRRIHV